MNLSTAQIQEFVEGYLKALLFCNEEIIDEGLTLYDFESDALLNVYRDCLAFIENSKHLMTDGDWEQM